MDASIEVGDGDPPGLWAAYDVVFGDQPDEATWRAEVWDRHRVRDGFRVATAARDEGGVAGFAYGYTGEHGQWWTDQVARTLPAEIASTWLGGHFEVVSVGVVPSARGVRARPDAAAGADHGPPAPALAADDDRRR